jgi:WD40 repeat protein
MGAFSPDGKRFVCLRPARYDRQADKWTQEDSCLWVLSAGDGSLISKEQTPPLSGFRQAIDWQGPLIAVSECYDRSRRGALIYDIAQHCPKNTLIHPEYGGSLSVKLSPDARTAAVGYGPYDVGLFDTSDGKVLHTLRSRNNWVVCLDFSPDGRLLASGEGDSAVRVWDVATGRQLQHFGMGPQTQSNYTNSVSFTPSGDLLACGTEDQRVVVWNVKNFRPTPLPAPPKY